MAVISRIATIKFNNTLSPGLSGRTFVATAAVQDTPAGSSVSVTITNTPTGNAADPAVPDTFTLRYVTDGGTVIRSVTLNNSAASQNDTFSFSSNGLTGSSPRCGTIEIKLQVTKTTGGPTATYDCETDGAPNTPPSLHTTTQLDRGWIRGTTTLIENVSNVGLGSAPILPAKYNESLFVRTTSADISYIARALSVAVSNTSPALSANTNSTTAGQRDVTFANVCDNRFPAAVTSVGVSVVVPNATLTGLPDWTYTATTDSSIDIDPRLTCEHLLQLDDDMFWTPPLVKNVGNGNRVFPSVGYLSTNIRDSRGSRVGDVITGGVNGITYTKVMNPQNPWADVTYAGRVTANHGGEDGWGSATLVMDEWSQFPAGNWDKTVTITAPSDITGAAYLLNSTITYAFVANSPTYQPAFYINNISNADRHVQAGDTLKVLATLTDLETWLRLAPSSASVFMTRVKNGILQILVDDLDNTDAAWANWGQADQLTSFALSPEADPTQMTRVFSNTAWWSNDILVRCQIVYQGATYLAVVPREITGVSNPHNSSLSLN